MNSINRTYLADPTAPVPKAANRSVVVPPSPGRFWLMPALRLIGAGLFWSWNVLFVLVSLFGLVPLLGRWLWLDLSRGLLPWDMAATLLAMSAIPLLSVATGARWRNRPALLGAMFYGLELPLFFACGARVFLVRQLTLATAMVLLAFCVGVVGYGGHLFLPKATRQKPWTHMYWFAAVVLVHVAFVGAILLTLYTAPFAVEIVKEIVALQWASVFRRPDAMLMSALLGGLVGYTATLFVVMPILAPALWCTAAWQAFGAQRRQSGKLATYGIAVATSLCLIGGFVLANRQPQGAAFAQLSKLPTSDNERLARLDAAGSLKKGLLNAYLAPYRYLAARGEAGFVARTWAERFGGSEEDYAFVQALHDLLAAPFLYDGASLLDKQQTAARLYADFFDVPLQEGERQEVRAALSATYDRDAAEAGVLERDAQRVHLDEQRLSVREAQGFAEVELFEAYVNDTEEEQEVLYHFALPESAVVTGLWLGSSPRREQATAFVVAPRGAAARVYRTEVYRQVDPALLEQVGPRQYRLRAFPVPARLAGEPARPLYLWMRYSVLPSAAGWPLPELLERRNVYWDGDSERVVVRDSTRQEIDNDAWLPAVASATFAPQPMTVDLEGWQVHAEPHRGSTQSAVPRDVAIVVDRSRSMAGHRQALSHELAWLAAHLPADTDVYLSAAKSRGEPPEKVRLGELEPDKIIFYGGEALSEMLGQFLALAPQQPYEGVLVLTDDGGSRLEPKMPEPLRIDAPLWLVHLTQPASGYADVVTDLLMRPTSGIAHSSLEVFARMAAARAGQHLADGYLWRLDPAPNARGTSRDLSAGLSQLGAHQLLRKVLADAGDLDQAHALASRFGMVTPVSSMVVLVNERQRQDLARAEAAANRFQREVDSGEQALSAPGGIIVSGTPEPHEWALVLLAAGSLVWAYRRSRAALGHHAGVS